MLTPDVPTVAEQLTALQNDINDVDRFAFSAMNTTIGKLSPDPDWLPSIRLELDMLRDQGAQWQAAKPGIVSEIITPFSSYYSLLDGIAQTAEALGDDTAAWLELMRKLSEQAKQNMLATEAAQRAFVERIQQLGNVEKLLSGSVDKAWAALADEEAAMVAIANELGVLNTQLAGLQSKLTWTEIGAGKSITQSTVSIIYTLATSASVPYLSILGLVVTVGKSLYDVITTSEEIQETIDKIGELRLDASIEAQAAAMTKTVIQLIQSFDTSMASLHGSLPAFGTLWSAQKEKVDEVIDALNGGAEPTSVLSIITLPAAVAGWKQLVDLNRALMATPPMGKPVTLTV